MPSDITPVKDFLTGRIVAGEAIKNGNYSILNKFGQWVEENLSNMTLTVSLLLQLIVKVQEPRVSNKLLATGKVIVARGFCTFSGHCG